MTPRSMKIILARLAFAAMVIWFGGAEPTQAADGDANPQEIEFFERHVRPILVARCVACHGPEKQEAGLRLDEASSVSRGGDSGPVIVPGRTDRSRLIKAIRYTGEIQMPPDAKLPDSELAALTEWVHSGAVWPTEVTAKSTAASPSRASALERIPLDRANHWAFRPLRSAEGSSGESLSKGPALGSFEVDHWIQAGLENAGLTPSPPAEGRALLRRVTFDLAGLPPTFEEMADFLADDSPEAYERVVDRLLASPQYGERWGRHWLDVARYADTKGYVFMQERRYPFAYTYRDYVADAFNVDRPIDRFVQEQLAADQLPTEPLADDGQGRMAALGFLTVGRRFMLNPHDIIDDRIDVVTRGLLGLTVTCARCHDHKFDAIPTEDYYSLYGVFASCQEPETGPLLGSPEASAAYDEFQRELEIRRQAAETFRVAEHRNLENKLRDRATDYLVRAALLNAGLRAESPGKEGAQGKEAGEDLRPRIVERWQEYLQKAPERHASVFGPWKTLADLAPERFEAEAPPVLAALKSSTASSGSSESGSNGAGSSGSRVNARVAAALAGLRPVSMIDVAKTYGALLSDVEKAWRELKTKSPDAARLDDPDAEEIRQAFLGEDSPTVIPPEMGPRLFDRDIKEKYTALKRKVEQWEVESPAAPARAMALEDLPNPVSANVFIRGNPNRPGAEVPRRFPRLLSADSSSVFSEGSGRLELARAITQKQAPLFGRVFVNRVWLHHFGSSLVETPSDFGVRTPPPTHPELLDALVSRFLTEGWSLKRLHRTIVLSDTYRRSSDERIEASAIDPENRWYWRMNGRRLEFEAARDSLLAVSGELDRRLGGKPVDLLATPFTTRRTLYGLIDRQDLPGFFRDFDFANPDVSNDRRPRTTVPQQALFVMNSPFAIERARKLASRLDAAGTADVARRVELLYRLVFARDPEPVEEAAAIEFIQSHDAAKSESTTLNAWEELAQVLCWTNEFMFID